jgi:hypothetical protein
LTEAALGEKLRVVLSRLCRLSHDHRSTATQPSSSPDQESILALDFPLNALVDAFDCIRRQAGIFFAAARP